MKRKLTVATVMLLLVFFGFSSSWAGTSDPGTAINSNASQNQGMAQSQNIINYSGGEGGEIPRNFPYAATPNYPPVANYWGTITPDGRFDPMSNILLFQPVWTMADAKAYAEQDGGKIKVIIPKPREGTVPSRALTFIVTKPQNPEELAKFNQEYAFIVRGTFLAEKRAISSKVFGYAVQEGLLHGADVALYDEGFGLRLDAQSIGISLQGTLSAVNGGGGMGIGGVSGSGLGWVNAWAEYYTKPWLKVSFFKRRPLPAPVAVTPLPAPLPPREDRG